MSHLINNLPLVIQDAAAVESLAGAIKDDMGMLWMLLSGILVFFMQAGFTLVESGMTRSKNAVNIAMKNLLDIAVGSLTYWFVGYSLMYGDTSNGWFFWSGIMQGEGADLFFQTMFAATAATIVSGAIAGRTKYSTYVIFSIVMTAIIYPIAGGWQWQGSGWLTELGFIDFAGSSIVHAVGGFAALVAAYLVGPRIGKFVDGKVMPIPGHNQILATLGVFILWLGWFGFNGGSQLAWGGDDAVAASTVVLITNLAAAAGALGALITTWIWYGKPHLAQSLKRCFSWTGKYYCRLWKYDCWWCCISGSYWWYHCCFLYRDSSKRNLKLMMLLELHLFTESLDSGELLSSDFGV